MAAEPQLSHMVYFKLKDNSDAATQKFVAACQEYLSDHEGTIYFSVGVMAKDLNRDVNDRDFDAALNLVFRDKAAHDKYSAHERHVKFIEKCKDSWSKGGACSNRTSPRRNERLAGGSLRRAEPEFTPGDMVGGPTTDVGGGRCCIEHHHVDRHGTVPISYLGSAKYRCRRSKSFLLAEAVNSSYIFRQRGWSWGDCPAGVPVIWRVP